MAKVFLAVQGVGGEQDAPQAQLRDQRLRRRDLVALGDLLMGQDERRLAGEGAEHLGGGPVVQVVEAAAQRLAVQRDDPPPRRGGSVTKLLGMAAEGGLDLGRVERVQEGAPRVDGRGAAEAGAEGGVEPLAMRADEQADAAVGGGAGQDGQHRQDAEQQRVGEAVAPALAAARVGDPVQGGEQAGERHHWRPPVRGTVGPQQPSRAAGPSAAGPALTNRSWPEPNSPGVTGEEVGVISQTVSVS